MQLLTFSNTWTFFYFAPLSYLFLLALIIFYLLPLSNSLAQGSSTKTTFVYNTGNEVLPILTLFLYLLLLITFSWSAPAVSAWFGHLIITSFQLKISLVLYAVFFLVITADLMTTYFSTKDPYDALITKLSMMYWLVMLFFTNSLLTMAFVIEVMSALLFLLLVTSAYSNTYYYNNTDLSSHSYFNNTLPYSYITSIMFFFWTSLIASLNLFLYMIYLYTSFFTLDWFLIEHIYGYLMSSSTYKDIAKFAVIFMIFIFAIFLKCGIAPFFVWKPSFFKGLPINMLYYYVTYFYFTIFIFFIHLFTSYLACFTYGSVYVLIFCVLIGMLVLISILFESMFIKTFIALSSILNSLLVLLAITSSHNYSLFFFM